MIDSLVENVLTVASLAVPNLLLVPGAYTKLASLGFSPLPIMPGEKKPGSYGNGTWYAMQGWTRFCSERPDQSYLKRWEKWAEADPAAGAGIACGTLRGIDIDVLDEGLAALAEAEAVRILGPTPLVRVGLFPKRLLVYRTERPQRKRKSSLFTLDGEDCALEVLGHGQQFVAYGTHPKTGKPYTWTAAQLLETPIEAVPMVTEDQITQLLSAFDSLADMWGAEIKTRSLPPGSEVASNDPRDINDRVPSAIAALTNNDRHYDDWIRIGIAIKRSVEDPGLAFGLWDSWSQKSSKYNDALTADAWESFDIDDRKATVGAGTIIAEARAEGYVLPQAPVDFEPIGPGVGDAALEDIQAVSPTATKAVATKRPKAARAPLPGFDFSISAEALMAMQFEDVRWVVDGLIPEGLTILAGAPKIGKSWLVSELATETSAGGMLFGKYRCPIGAVLMLALEDNPRRLQSRFQKMKAKATPNLAIRNSWRRLNEGGVEDIAAWLDANPDARLVIIDTLAKVKPKPTKGASGYDADSDALAPLQRLALERRIAVIIVHHDRKAKDPDDWLNQVSGTLGLSGVADTIMLLRRARGAGKHEATLNVTGRDVEEAQVGLAFDPEAGRWKIANLIFDDFDVPPEQGKILPLLGQAGVEGLMLGDIAQACDKAAPNVGNMLKRLKLAGAVFSPSRGRWALSV